jgi:hypothetical protein
MNNRDRDEFYLSKPAVDNDEDGDDYELEPPDAGVLAAEEQRGREAIEASRASIDIDEIYRDAGRQRSEEILQNWFKDFQFKFRFQTKHLLIAAAALAVILTLWKFGMLGTALVLLMMISVFGLYFYFSWQEQKAEDEATRRREEMYARRRAQQQKTSGGRDTA